MPKREVTQGFTTYTDESGTTRFATAGEEVNVHKDNLARFDAINGGADSLPKKAAAPKKR